MEKGLIVRARKKDNEAIAEIIQLTERKGLFRNWGISIYSMI